MLTGLTEVLVIEAIGLIAPEQHITSIMVILFVESAKQNNTTKTIRLSAPFWRSVYNRMEEEKSTP